MKDLRLLIWLTQLGLSVAAPPAGFVLLALWLKSQFGWGNWVVIVGVIFGVVGAVNGLLDSLKALKKLTKSQDKEPPSLSFNDHD